ncbi:uncharacterized protein ACWYII_035815 [Salvelinus alpinus]
MTTMTANPDRKAKKRNFIQCEMEILVGEVEARKNILFGGHSVGITNAKKALEWQHVAAVNAAGSEGQWRPIPLLLDEGLASIIGESLLNGVVTEVEGDTDMQDAPDDPGM